MYRGLYQKRKVLSLEESALKTFGNTLIRTLDSIYSEQSERQIVDQIQNYMKSIIGTTLKINEQLLHLISISNLKYSVRVLGLQTLLNESVKRFEDNVAFDLLNNKFWNIFTKQSEGLHVLNLENTPLTDNRNGDLADVLEKCPNLNQLRLPYICTDKVLRTVAEKCAKIRFLKLTTNHFDMERGVEFLSESKFSKTLTAIELDVINYNFDKTVCPNVAKALQCCPNVETLLMFPFISNALQICRENNKNFKCNLKVICNIKPTQEEMQVIVDTCPKLKSVILMQPLSGALQALRHTSLERLVLKKVNCTELMELLEKMGHQLRFLSISEVNAALDIANIARFCPSLLAIDLQIMNDLKVGSTNFSFTYLEKLTIRESPLANKDFTKLISSCRALRLLRIDQLKITDQHIKDIFSINDFINLEEFYIFDAPELTIASVKLLLLKCPGLQKIGPFSGWNITQRDIKTIRCLEKCGKNDFILTSPNNNNKSNNNNWHNSL